jgi:hemoglobin
VAVSEQSLYERVGGQPWFDRLVDRFYEGVEADPLLRPMYPEDLTDAKRHLALFLAQYWGGPGTYSLERGHPRLRMRHVPFVVDAAARDAWLTHMEAAVAAEPPDAEANDALLAYFRHAADFLVNHPG